MTNLDFAVWGGQPEAVGATNSVGLEAACFDAIHRNVPVLMSFTEAISSCRLAICASSFCPYYSSSLARSCASDTLLNGAPMMSSVYRLAFPPDFVARQLSLAMG